MNYDECRSAKTEIAGNFNWKMGRKVIEVGSLSWRSHDRLFAMAVWTGDSNVT